MRNAGRSVGLLLGLLLAAAEVRAQVQTPAAPDNQKSPSYDVATIKPNKTGSGSSHISVDDGIFQTENVSLRSLLQSAFDVRKEQIEGLPPWAESARFDINAKVVDTDIAVLRKLKDEQRRTMMQELYADRFGLKWHFETRVLPAYELVTLKSGVKLQVAKNPDDTNVSQHNASLRATGMSMSRLAEVLSDELHRPVVDKTDLSGRYDFELKWTPDDANLGRDRGVKEEDAPPVLFTALQEQLGLRLQGGKDPVPVLVIDRLELPTEN